MNMSAVLPSLAVAPRARSRSSSRLSACPTSSSSAFARGHAALRVKRIAAAPAAASPAPTCSIFGRRQAKKEDAAWSSEETQPAKSSLAVFDWVREAMAKIRTPALALALVAALALAVPDAAQAAKSGGRVGGSSFRRCVHLSWQGDKSCSVHCLEWILSLCLLQRRRDLGSSDVSEPALPFPHRSSSSSSYSRGSSASSSAGGGYLETVAGPAAERAGRKPESVVQLINAPAHEIAPMAPLSHRGRLSPA